MVLRCHGGQKCDCLWHFSLVEHVNDVNPPIERQLRQEFWGDQEHLGVGFALALLIDQQLEDLQNVEGMEAVNGEQLNASRATSDVELRIRRIMQRCIPYMQRLSLAGAMESEIRTAVVVALLAMATTAAAKIAGVVQ